MNEPSIKFGENVTTEDERGNVNVTWQMVLKDVPASDAWQIGLAIAAIARGYEDKWRKAAEAKEYKVSELWGEDWQLGTTEDTIIPEGSNPPIDWNCQCIGCQRLRRRKKADRRRQGLEP